MTINSDKELIQAALRDSPHVNVEVLSALNRLSTGATRYEWVLPIVSGINQPAAAKRAAVLDAGMNPRRLGDSLIAWAMRQRQP